MAEILDLTSAVSELVHDGDCVALEGFTHLIPFAAAHEIIRQGRRDLTLARFERTGGTFAPFNPRTDYQEQIHASRVWKASAERAPSAALPQRLNRVAETPQRDQSPP